MMVGEMEAKEKPRPSPDYLMQLMNDKKLMSSLPNFCGIFTHLERLLDEEISRVRKDMYTDTMNGLVDKLPMDLPDPIGPIMQLQEKLFVPVKEYPDFNFVGRILGPRGLTAKQLEAETGCKIMVRGKSSMRDKKKEEQNRGKPNWEHLNEDLHVLITVEDTQDRAELKLRRAVEEVKKLLVPAQAEGEDNLKKMQLMELAILNGTYRDANIKAPTAQGPRLITGPGAPMLPPAALRASTQAGPAIMNIIRPIQTTAVMPNGTPHPGALVPPSPEAGIIYTTPYDYPYALTPAGSLLEYPMEPSGVLGAMATKVRRHDSRVHPYQRIVTADRDLQGWMNPLVLGPGPYKNLAGPQFKLYETKGSPSQQYSVPNYPAATSN
ncbi:protein quaking-like isoform X5 [Amblyraja radiata]|uniref:protein quaking-like isoform X5 n=1 Tax=Amblyraja radiata TaxID=386614 RepID=UPI0014038D05|nr:protein quaking-like isoform X5 [Amblyraja radiata]